MGHHKSGELSEQNVGTVKDRLRILGYSPPQIRTLGGALAALDRRSKPDFGTTSSRSAERPVTGGTGYRSVLYPRPKLEQV